MEFDVVGVFASEQFPIIGRGVLISDFEQQEGCQRQQQCLSDNDKGHVFIIVNGAHRLEDCLEIFFAAGLLG